MIIGRECDAYSIFIPAIMDGTVRSRVLGSEHAVSLEFLVHEMKRFQSTPVEFNSTRYCTGRQLLSIRFGLMQDDRSLQLSLSL
jgi:hypothetical protein